MFHKLLHFFKFNKKKTQLQSFETLKRLNSADLRILFFLDAYGPTYSISFELPLTELKKNKSVEFSFITQNEINNLKSAHLEQFYAKIKDIKPHYFIFSRYGGNHYKELLDLAQNINAKTIYHIDDNLFDFPIDMLEIYKQRHLNPEVLQSRQFLLTQCDTAYCSTSPLEEILKKSYSLKKSFSGIYCPYPGIGAPHSFNDSQILGYMGTKSHIRDLEPTLPLISEFLQKNPSWKFELFGDFTELSFPKSIRHQIIYSPPVRGYDKFRYALNQKKWAAAIAPLSKDSFNLVKAPTKFIEYTAMGAVSILTSFGPYKKFCDSQSAFSLEIMNADILSEILNNKKQLRDTHIKAQKTCESEFSMKQLTTQIEHVLSL